MEKTNVIEKTTENSSKQVFDSNDIQKQIDEKKEQINLLNSWDNIYKNLISDGTFFLCAGIVISAICFWYIFLSHGYTISTLSNLMLFDFSNDLSTWYTMICLYFDGLLFYVLYKTAKLSYEIHKIKKEIRALTHKA